MKLKKKQRRTIEITHGQGIKQSANYQSADCAYTVKVVVEDTPKDIKRGIARAEKLVEDALALKVTQQRKFLLKLSGDTV